MFAGSNSNNNSIARATYIHALIGVRPSTPLFSSLLLGHAHARAHVITSQEGLYERTKSWTFTRADYPSNAVPTFPQGNALVLTRDLAAEVAQVADQPWLRLMADDVLVALVLRRFRPYELVARADYEFHGTYTACNDASLWHFNIHPEHMYDLWHNWLLRQPSCRGITRFCCG